MPTEPIIDQQERGRQLRAALGGGADVVAGSRILSKLIAARAAPQSQHNSEEMLVEDWEVLLDRAEAAEAAGVGDVR